MSSTCCPRLIHQSDSFLAVRFIRLPWPLFSVPTLSFGSSMNPLPQAWTLLESHISNDKLGWPLNVAARYSIPLKFWTWRKNSRIAFASSIEVSYGYSMRWQTFTSGQEERMVFLRTFSANCERKNCESIQNARPGDQKTGARKAPRIEGALDRIQADAPFGVRPDSKAIGADRPILRSSDPVGFGAA